MKALKLHLTLTKKEVDIATAEEKKGSLDFVSLPNLKENPLVGNVDGKKKPCKKYGNSAPSK